MRYGTFIAMAGSLLVAGSGLTGQEKSIIPAAAYHDVNLQGLDGSGFLDGEFVSTRPTTNRTKSATNTFVFSAPPQLVAGHTYLWRLVSGAQINADFSNVTPDFDSVSLHLTVAF